MRWKKRKRKPIPNDGEKRVVSKFLYFPLCINNEYRWLEKVKVEQEYVGVEIHSCRGAFGSDSFYTTGGYWMNLEYVDY